MRLIDGLGLNAVNSLGFGVRRMTAGLRVAPSFLIIGAQKAGTTSLYRYLVRHRCVVGAYKKEVHYFDLNYTKPAEWYRAHFPLQVRLKLNKTALGCRRSISGEASPYYLFHPDAPRRVDEQLANVKLIVLLRNPIDRAVSHYHHERRKGREKLGFEEAISVEKIRLEEDRPSNWRQGKAYSYAHHRHSYLTRGEYGDQLRRWFRFFSKSDLLIIKSEEFFANQMKTLEEVCGFLGLEDPSFEVERVHGSGEYEEIDEELRERLEPYCRRVREDVAAVTGRDFGW